MIIPHPSITYVTHVADASLASDRADEFDLVSENHESVEIHKRLVAQDRAAQLFLIEFVHANYEALKEAFT